jgi:putative transposase
MAGMPRRGRCIIPEVACHVTQRGVDRQETFSADDDRLTYLHLLRDNLADAAVGILAWGPLTNHVHFVAVPEPATSLRILYLRLPGAFAQYYNARWVLKPLF